MKEKKQIKEFCVLFFICMFLCMALVGCDKQGKSTNRVNADSANNGRIANENDEQASSFLENMMQQKDVHSIWIDGIEIKILEYIDADSMCVKLAVGKCMVQAVVPRSLEDGTYVGQYDSETWGGQSETRIRFVNKEKTNVIMFSNSSGEGISEVYQKSISNLSENAYEFQSLNNGKGVIEEISLYDISLSDYDDKVSLDGYAVAICDSSNEIVCSMGILDLEEDGYETEKKYLEELAFRQRIDDDYIYIEDVLPADFEDRIKSQYQVYQTILNEGDSVLYEKYKVPGENYEKHYLCDLTKDGIPEIIFMGSPKWICIIGEKNAINIGGEQIEWNIEEGCIFIRSSWAGEITWTKYAVEKDSQGYLVLKNVKERYLECTLSKDGNNWSYYYDRKEVDKDTYMVKEKELFAVKFFEPKEYETWVITATETGMYRSVMKLNDEKVYE